MLETSERVKSPTVALDLVVEELEATRLREEGLSGGLYGVVRLRQPSDVAIERKAILTSAGWHVRGWSKSEVCPPSSKTEIPPVGVVSVYFQMI